MLLAATQQTDQHQRPQGDSHYYFRRAAPRPEIQTQCPSQVYTPAARKEREGENSHANPAKDARRNISLVAECAPHSPEDTSKEREINSEVDASPAEPAGSARGVEEEDEEDAKEGEGDEDDGRDGAACAAGGEEGESDDEEDGGEEAEEGGGVDGAGVIFLGDVVRGGVDEAGVGGDDGVGVGVGGVAGCGGEAVEGGGGCRGGGCGFFGGGRHWDVGWWFGEGDV
ncbi:hypothetical protein V499_03634 [Pseudogymnoascus sp. VKM F-103]|nr:hypothetical protein V499_03634 [Pseudogymnoascus sp. VKM F-103]